MEKQEKPKASKYQMRGRMSIEATHPHRPPVAWCPLCRREAAQKQGHS